MTVIVRTRLGNSDVKLVTAAGPPDAREHRVTKEPGGAHSKGRTGKWLQEGGRSKMKKWQDRLLIPTKLCPENVNHWSKPYRLQLTQGIAPRIKQDYANEALHLWFGTWEIHNLW